MKIRLPNPLTAIILLYVFLLLGWAVFSYALTAPNLILTQWPPYWQFQNWMWTTFFHNRQLLTYTFVGIISGLILSYGAILYLWPKKQSLPWWLPALIALPLLFSQNALSYDLFNYIFNAKMVLVYQANPHIQTALEFAYDPWVRFMHNTHTSAPYFYGWTGLSLLPYLLGMGRFLSTWAWFKLFAYLSFILLSLTLTKWFPPQQQDSANRSSAKLQLLVLLNPLLLIEIGSSSHNDLWMMVPALISILLLVKSRKRNIPVLLSSLLLLLFSISIKYATAVLIPVWIVLLAPSKWCNYLPKVLRKIIFFCQKHWAALSSIGLFLPLLTPRSKQFLPWYLLWSLVWIPYIKPGWNWWQHSLVILSFSALFRYAPFLLAGNYEGAVSTQQLVVTWSPLIITWLYLISNWLWHRATPQLQ